MGDTHLEDRGDATALTVPRLMAIELCGDGQCRYLYWLIVVRKVPVAIEILPSGRRGAVRTWSSTLEMLDELRERYGPDVFCDSNPLAKGHMIPDVAALPSDVAVPRPADGDVRTDRPGPGNFSLPAEDPASSAVARSVALTTTEGGHRARPLPKVPSVAPAESPNPSPAGSLMPAASAGRGGQACRRATP